MVKVLLFARIVKNWRRSVHLPQSFPFFLFLILVEFFYGETAV